MSIIDSIMSAIGHVESGGNYDSPPHMDEGFWNLGGKYQILESNWSSWAQNAGLSPNAPYTAENQDIVARSKITELYNQYGDANLVASAWNGGGGGANSFKMFGLDSYEAGYVQKFNDALSNLGQDIKNTVNNTPTSNSVNSGTNSSTGVLSSISTLSVRFLYTIVGVVILVAGFFLLFKDNTMILKKEES